jgi:hypothetical protein
VSLPGTNSTLLAVEAHGALDRRGSPTGPGAALWTGSADGYLERNERLLEGAGMVSQNDRREISQRAHRLILFRISGAPLNEIGGPDSTAETILLQDRRDPTSPATHRWTIVGTEYNARGMDADNIILTLDNPEIADG